MLSLLFYTGNNPEFKNLEICLGICYSAIARELVRPQRNINPSHILKRKVIQDWRRIVKSREIMTSLASQPIKTVGLVKVAILKK